MAIPAPITLSNHDLPLFCPRPSMALWSAHPRVFLDISQHGKATCPYCGATYVLDTTQHADT